MKVRSQRLKRSVNQQQDRRMIKSQIYRRCPNASKHVGTGLPLRRVSVRRSGVPQISLRVASVAHQVQSTKRGSSCLLNGSERPSTLLRSIQSHYIYLICLSSIEATIGWSDCALVLEKMFIQVDAGVSLSARCQPQSGEARLHNVFGPSERVFLTLEIVRFLDFGSMPGALK